MFGFKRLLDDMGVALDRTKCPSDKESGDKLFKAFSRFGKTNFIAGSLASVTGAVAGILVNEAVKKIKEKK